VKKFFGPPEGTVSYSALGKKSIPTDWEEPLNFLQTHTLPYSTVCTVGLFWLARYRRKVTNFDGL
jgi:hypothetical protein